MPHRPTPSKAKTNRRHALCPKQATARFDQHNAFITCRGGSSDGG